MPGEGIVAVNVYGVVVSSTSLVPFMKNDTRATVAPVAVAVALPVRLTVPEPLSSVLLIESVIRGALVVVVGLVATTVTEFELDCAFRLSTATAVNVNVPAVEGVNTYVYGAVVSVASSVPPL